MSKFGRLAIIGVGPSAIFLLKHLLRNIDRFQRSLTDVYLFDKQATLGTGMPYHRNTTDKYNLCNISSAEIPLLNQSLVDWLHSLSDEELVSQDIQRCEIDEDETYRRTTLGDYFHAQYASIAKALRAKGLTLHEHSDCSVTDVVDHPPSECVEIRFSKEESVIVERLVISTGHSFLEPDEEENGYYTSPWPMQKLIPGECRFHNFEIGTLGASLSAFDVVSSLSHRHGKFIQRGGKLAYEPYPGADRFKISLHSAQGWLPHLQYEQEESFREIYRHIKRDTMLALLDKSGFLSLDVYFDQVCRPALAIAFQKDQRADIVQFLSVENASLEDFIETLSDEHTADDPFSLMRLEMPEASRAIRKGIPIYWKETLDDLMFTLNFHYDLLPAEDHVRYHRVIVPFLMNVIAAMPLHSANILLALHDAGRLDLVPGKVTIKEKRKGRTVIEIANDDQTIEREYRMFVNCSGQGSLDFDCYPFKSMTADGTATEAVAYFGDASAMDPLNESESDNLVERNGRKAMRLGGVAIDGFYRVIGQDGLSNDRIHDIAFPHATGVRPYSYGLQACEVAASIVIQCWCSQGDNNQKLTARTSSVTQVYENLPEPTQPVAGATTLTIRHRSPIEEA